MMRYMCRIWQWCLGSTTSASALRIRIYRVLIEDILIALARNPQCPPRLRRYPEQLNEKYLVPGVTVN